MTDEERERLDPSHNVTGVMTAAVGRLDDLAVLAHQRTDDLRKAEARRVNDLLAATKELVLSEVRHLAAMADVEHRHAKELNEKEASRLDSIRQVDREDGNKGAAAAQTAIATLAKQTTDLATTLQSTVQDTAQTAEARRATDMSEVNRRVSALELTSSEGKGKSAIADPALAELAAELRKLTSVQSTSGGKSLGVSSTVAGVVVMITLLLSLAGIVVMAWRTSAGASVPAGYTMVPSSSVP